MKIGTYWDASHRVLWFLGRSALNVVTAVTRGKTKSHKDKAKKSPWQFTLRSLQSSQYWHLLQQENPHACQWHSKPSPFGLWHQHDQHDHAWQRMDPVWLWADGTDETHYYLGGLTEFQVLSLELCLPFVAQSPLGLKGGGCIFVIKYIMTN